jgi:hypothetical protein
MIGLYLGLGIGGGGGGIRPPSGFALLVLDGKYLVLDGKYLMLRKP